MEVATRANLVFLARKLLEEEENSVVTEEDFKVFVVKLLDYVSVLKKFRVTEDKGEEGEAEGREEVGEGVEEGEEEEGGEDLPGGRWPWPGQVALARQGGPGHARWPWPVQAALATHCVRLPGGREKPHKATQGVQPPMCHMSGFRPQVSGVRCWCPVSILEH